MPHKTFVLQLKKSAKLRMVFITALVVLSLLSVVQLMPANAETSAPTACAYRQPVQADKWGTLTYVNYNFNIPNITKISNEIEIKNTPAPGFSNTNYIQLYDGMIGGRYQYYGLQTHGMAIWSQWGTTLEDVRTVGNSYTTVVSYEDNAVSLRRDLPPLQAGHYSTRIELAEFDGVGDWYNYYVKLPNESEQLIGGMRFRRQFADQTVKISDGGGQWNEFAFNNYPTISPVALLDVDIKATANNGVKPVRAIGKFSTMPNAEITVVGAPGDYINTVLGGTTPRCRTNAPYEQFELWNTYVPPVDTVPPTAPVTTAIPVTTAVPVTTTPPTAPVSTLVPVTTTPPTVPVTTIAPVTTTLPTVPVTTIAPVTTKAPAVTTTAPVVIVTTTTPKISLPVLAPGITPTTAAPTETTQITTPITTAPIVTVAGVVATRPVSVTNVSSNSALPMTGSSSFYLICVALLFVITGGILLLNSKKFFKKTNTGQFYY